MSINSINYSSSVLGSQIRNINQQLTDLSTQLSTGKLSPNYSGMGTNEGHRRGAAQIDHLLAWSAELGIPVVTLWLLSTENLLQRRGHRRLADPA